jgi:hypothetical protein
LRSDYYIVIVGPCASGKSTLRAGLQAQGFTQVRVVAQEHSGVRDLWKLRGYPEVLIYLDARAETANARQGRSDWTPAAHAEQSRVCSTPAPPAISALPTDDLSPASGRSVESFIAAHTHPVTLSKTPD